MNKNKIIKLLKLLNKIHHKNHSESEGNHISQKGRTKTYDDFCIFKIYILMNVLNIKTIKGVWQFLNQEKDIRKLCGLDENIDRTTLNRRLNAKYKVL